MTSPPVDGGEDYGGLQQPTSGYAAFQQGDAPAGGTAKQGGGGAPAPKPAKAKPKPKPKPKPEPKPPVPAPKVRIRVDDMDGALAANAVIVNQVAGLITAAGVEVDIAYGRFTQRELEFDGVIPVVIVSEPATTDQADRWTANQDAMNLEASAAPTTLAKELPAPTSTGNSIREIVGSTRVLTTGKQLAVVNALHAPVVISVGRLLKIVNAHVPKKFAGQVFVNEISATIAHECGHAFGLVVSPVGGPDKHPSDARNVMSRDTLDSLGGIKNLPKGDSDWARTLKNYQLPTFTADDAKLMQGVVETLRVKIEGRQNIEWKVPPSKTDRVPDPKHFAPPP